MSTHPSRLRPGEQLAFVLAGVEIPRPGSAVLEVDLTGFAVQVQGIGALPERLTPAVIRRLVALASPAPFGLGTQTLLDPAVRDTWQIPTELVEIAWADRLDSVLEAAREGLGLPQASALSVELHSMLVYEKGQFFAPHRDSEKADAMVATLVLTLPSRHTGGELIVHDGTQPLVHSASATTASLVVLYADRVHEVRPVRSGYRVCLTFNVMLDEPVVPQAAPEAIDRVADLLTGHFASPVPARWTGDHSEPPRRYVYLLDHEYTPRGLSWSRLKGTDIERAGLLRAAIERVGGEAVLALTQIHEIWDADVDDWGYRGSRRRGSWRDGPISGDEVDVNSLIDSETGLTHWLLPGQRHPTAVSLHIDSREVFASTPTSQLEPDTSEYEGYMGNYGNTVDRWYHRAALLVWPTRMAFANRAEVDPDAAVADLHARAATAGQAGQAGQADLKSRVAADIASLGSLWPSLVRQDGPPDRLATVLDLATHVDRESADVLLGPFGVTALRPQDAPALESLASTHGETWLAGHISAWQQTGRRRPDADSPAWLAGLPELAGGLCGIALVAEALLGPRWNRLEARMSALAAAPATRRVEQQLSQESDSFGALLHASVTAGLPRLTESIAHALTSGPATLLPLSVAVVRAAGSWPPEVRTASGLEEVAWNAVRQLREEISHPQRAAGDWSINRPMGCTCDDCRRVDAFLGNPGERVAEMPLAEARRNHVSSQIAAADLPVTAQTRKTGRPYTLVLTKTPELFERESVRRAWVDGALAKLVGFLSG